MFFQNPDSAFRIMGVFRVKRGNEKSVFNTGRKHTTIAYRLQGEGQFQYCGTAVTAAAGSVTYIPAGLDFWRRSTPEELIVVHLQGFGTIGDQIEVVNQMEQIAPLFQNLLSVWAIKDPLAYNRSMQLLYRILEFLQNASGQSVDSVPSIIEPGMQLLYARYKSHDLRISQLADACFISEVYFRKLFRQHFGKSPQQALTEMRFRYACDLLSSGYYTQKEAAQLAGFSDVKYFRTAFKKHFALTPAAYINKAR